MFSVGHLGHPHWELQRSARRCYGQGLRYNPADPKWINRDRFILSAGHGSMFLYAWLHLSGYEVSLEEVRNFRQLGKYHAGTSGSRLGVEATTGPLGRGQECRGIRGLSEDGCVVFNTDEHTIFGQHIVAAQQVMVACRKGSL
ncbi:MAG: hypothetical protein R3C01_07390 [Planctomycetaceae bacterium]